MLRKHQQTRVCH